MARLMNLAIDKIGGLEKETSGLKQEVAKNSQKLDVLSGQFNDCRGIGYWR